ncbi:DUF5320 domain-containing protein [Anaerovorax odorimutans]|uniref:DUF5320 domain-containing protein n=1 Tax=Anaerovorax odorimutans TaxID=109327 RepID=UPI0004018191|nr:DUF5320 domain-containing protein [Anaerovorax odorimutans]
MPRRDGSGPTGLGSMTGKGFGFCTGVNTFRNGCGFGLGLGLRNGCRQNYRFNSNSPKTQKELLSEQKELLENRLNFIKDQLDSIS